MYRPTKNRAASFRGIAFVGLGSNLGNPTSNVRRAIERLQPLSSKPLLRSSLWETTPVDCPPGSPSFINAAVGLTLRGKETPESLLAKLQRLEREFGRRPKKQLNEARPLDLDLITFGELIRNSEQLIVPHPRAHQRRFVLQPLCEIAPNLILPGQTKPVSQLLTALAGDEVVRRLESRGEGRLPRSSGQRFAR
jgi:2-amino-4-hydroxy-6-hydroxymethyldihydropteridine diphosphokinase